MDGRETDGSTTGARELKVSRVLREHDLEHVRDSLAARWVGEEGPRRSLRELADDVNRAVLESALEGAGLRPLDGEVENLYRLLTDDDVGAAQRTEAEAKLERNGLEPDALRSDFVSHQSVHTYLREHQGVQLSSTDDGDRAARAAETIQRTSGRLRSVTERTLERLDVDLTLGRSDVFVSIQVYCDDCGRQFEAEELLARGGCDCDA